MNTPWDVIDFVPYLRLRWRIPLIACLTAVLLTLTVSLLLPKRYTARVVISIDPPAGNDVRMATAVSPVYLESLKGYENVAAADSLFARAVEKFQLKPANSSEPVEALKRRVLRISKIRDTRILEISATLPDPRLAHQFAEYIAQEAVAMNQQENLAADRDRAEKVERQLGEARRRLDNARKASPAGSTSSAIEALEARNDADTELLSKLRHEIADEQADAAEYPTSSGTHARADALKATTAQLDHEIAINQTSINAASSRRELAEAELNIAQSEYAAVSNRLLGIEVDSGSGGERLRIIDAGIVPQRPSFPNTPLNVMLAMVTSGGASVLYVALVFNYEKRRVQDALFR